MKTKILMVCLGNICRSPLAEGILRSKVNPEKVIVDSAGTGGWHLGNPPDHRSIAIGLQHGIDIRNQRCRQFTVADFDQSLQWIKAIMPISWRCQKPRKSREKSSCCFKKFQWAPMRFRIPIMMVPMVLKKYTGYWIRLARRLQRT